MELLLTRDLVGGLFGGVKFQLMAKVRLSEDEAAAVKKYKMGETILYERPTVGTDPNSCLSPARHLFMPRIRPSPRDHELGNVGKSLSRPFAHVVMVASRVKHLKGLANLIGEALYGEERKRVSFLLSEVLSGFLDGFQQISQPKEKTVRGSAVRGRTTAGDPIEVTVQRRAIAGVAARSLQT